MTVGPLSSDLVNYLICRYLQESGHEDAAVQLQRDMDRANPQNLPAAHQIPAHNLVTLLQKGLLYRQLENLVEQAWRKANPNSIYSIEEPVEKETIVALKKELITNGLGNVNGDVLGNGVSGADSDPMDIDQNGHSPAIPNHSTSADALANHNHMAGVESQLSALQFIPLPVTNGPNVGSQVDKVLELGKRETTLLRLQHNHVLHCAWNPLHPSLLATAGTGALGRIWNISRAQTSSPNAELSASANDLYSPIKESVVTTAAWNARGDSLAIALRDYPRANINRATIWSRKGYAMHDLPILGDPILCFKWNPSGSLLLALAGNGSQSNITVWKTVDGAIIDSVTLGGALEDAAWVRDGEFLVCGGQLLQAYRIDAAGNISLSVNCSVPSDDDLWSVKFDPLTGIAATATHGRKILIWSGGLLLKSIDAHTDDITALEWQPVPNPNTIHAETPRLLASASQDGMVHIWNGRNPWQCIHTLNIGLHFPVLAISFSPDGFLIAAASYRKLLIWKALEGGLPKASWDAGSLGYGQWAMPGEITSDSDDTFAVQHCLSWDADGMKLAYGLQNRIALIDFRG
ncbi:MAG: Transducin (beta)-like 1 X-linked receptor 1 [Trizodia sp. TS-e1964]|nr:MAG: Transducin (beta)-like 1 X-linked receptor 1 [Trizodia sp. TS-e1964]